MGELPVAITFQPPNRRRRDLDGCIAAFKHGADAVAELLGVDDSRFVPTYRMGAAVPHGAVVFEVAA